MPTVCDVQFEVKHKKKKLNEPIALFKIMSREVHVPKSCPARIFEPFLKSCPSEVCVPRGRVPRGLTVIIFESFTK